LHHLADQAPDFVVICADGVESEMELPYAALHQLCTPILTFLARLPTRQRVALSVAFGLSGGPQPERLLIDLALLSLVSEAAEGAPVLCLVDDLQWLDAASARALAFLARNLAVEPVALVMAARTPHPHMSALPRMEIGGLPVESARELLDAAWFVPLDDQIREQLIAETQGNPLALIELPRGLSEQELVGGFGIPQAFRLPSRIEESYQRRLASLPEPTRRLLLVAAAEPTGDLELLQRAAARLGIDGDAAGPAVSEGLAEFAGRVRFRHPLVRSAVYRSAQLRDRQSVHQALADVTDPDIDADRRAWHRAQAAEGPDEDVAAELERSADRAQARGGVSAAAAFLERSTALTTDPGLRASRALASASANVQAGAFDTALVLLSVAERASINDHQRARVDLIRAQLAYFTGRGRDAPPLLLKAAKRLESVDAELSRTTYLDAISAAIFSGRLADNGGILDVARAISSMPRVPAPSLADLLLEGLSTFFIEGNAAALPGLRRAVETARYDRTHGDQLRCLWQAGVAALHVWDDESWEVLATLYVDRARATGTLIELPLALSSRSLMHLLAGQLNVAESLVLEAQTITEAIGSGLSPFGAMSLAAFRGDQRALADLTDSATRDALTRGEGIGLTVADWTNAVLCNGLGRYDQAVTVARRGMADSVFGGVSNWAAAELVEAAIRSGATQIAADAFSRLETATTASGTDWSLGVEARSRALLADGSDAERWYREAIEMLSRTRMRTDLARAHLVYGEWLRRGRRRVDSRAQLRTAADMFEAMGMQGFARRAQRELSATGETARKRAGVDRLQLTSQEAQVAQLASDGLTNSEIGSRLYISRRTVQHHLGNAFAKLGIRSRSELERALSRSGGTWR
jgi:DNA-binding CsgD family transcriptional regulator